MAQRDYEQQPEAPDLGASAQLETGQSLVAPPGADPLDSGYVPPDRPYGLDDDEVTAGAMRRGESHDARLAREQPDPALGSLEGPGAAEADPDRSGRLAPVQVSADTQPAGQLDAVDTGIDGGAASAEEAAVHVVGEPAELDDDLLDARSVDADLFDARSVDDDLPGGRPVDDDRG